MLLVFEKDIRPALVSACAKSDAMLAKTAVVHKDMLQQCKFTEDDIENVVPQMFWWLDVDPIYNRSYNMV